MKKLISSFILFALALSLYICAKAAGPLTPQLPMDSITASDYVRNAVVDVKDAKADLLYNGLLPGSTRTTQTQEKQYGKMIP